MWTGIKARVAKQLPLQAQRPVSIKDAKGRPLSQTDTPARPSAEHSVHAVGHALSVTHRLSRFTRLELNAAPCKATRVKASVGDLPRRSGNGAQYLTLASSRPHSWRDSSVVRRHWWSRSTSVQRVQVIFGSRQLQADQPVERAYKLILAHEISQAGCPSSTSGAG